MCDVILEWSSCVKCSALSRKWCEVGCKVVLFTNRKSYMGFPLVLKSLTLNDLERRSKHQSSITPVLLHVALRHSSPGKDCQLRPIQWCMRPQSLSRDRKRPWSVIFFTTPLHLSHNEYFWAMSYDHTPVLDITIAWQFRLFVLCHEWWCWPSEWVREGVEA